MNAQDMDKIYFITGNKSKFEEAKMIMDEALRSSGLVLLQKDLKLEEPQSIDQEEVVKSKAEQAFSQIGKPLICDDTAIYFEAYPRFPGTLTKFVFKSIGFKGVEKLLVGENRRAYFQTAVCYKDKDQCIVFKGTWKGRITEDVSNSFNPDWQYNSIFLPEGFDISLAELSIEERAKHSHRKKALEQLANYLSKKEQETTPIAVAGGD